MRVEVRDDGEPLDPATAAGHFAAFATAPRPRAVAGRGRVGRASAGDIVTAHGGAIQARPAPAAEPFVSFTVPAAG